MYCEEWVLVKRQGGVLTAQPLKCKCWSCELCAPMRARQLIRSAFMGRPDMFLTLTVNPARFHDAHERARMLARAWRLLRLRAMRKYKYKSLPFLAVFEKTKAGEPHLHILLRCKWMSQRWLSEQMDALIGAPIVDVRRVDGVKKIAAYVAKYVGKDPTRFVGAKRYWSSQDYELPDPREDENPPWEEPSFGVHKCSMFMFLKDIRNTGFVMVSMTNGVATLIYDWEHSRADIPEGRVA